MAARVSSFSAARRARLPRLVGAGLAVTAVALWLRFAWAPRHVGSAAEIASSYIRLGSQAALAGRFTQAVDFHRRAVALDPRNVNAWIGLGSACADADDRAGALHTLKRAQELDPDVPDVDRALARVYLRFHRFAEARRAAEQALRRAPDDPYTLVLVGLARAEALSDASDEAVAEAVMQRALALGYRGPEPYYGRGLVALHRHRYEQAVAAFRAAVQRDPRSGTMHYRLASACRLAGRGREADRQLKEFRRLTQQRQGETPPTAPAGL